MSNPQRATTAPTPIVRKQTRRTEEARRASERTGLRLSVGGESYTLMFGDVTPAIAARLRREFGCGLMKIITTLATEGPDVDLVGALLWVSRLVDGEEIALEDVAVSYDDILTEAFDMSDLDGNAEEVAGPEA